jgi:hypothetical protein
VPASEDIPEFLLHAISLGGIVEGVVEWHCI